MSAVHQPVVYFIRQHHQVVLLGDVSDFLQTLPAEHRTRWVVGVADQQRLGARVIAASISAPVTWKAFSKRVGIFTGSPPAKVTSAV